MAKITVEQIDRMKWLFNKNKSIPEIAQTVGCSTSSVRKYLDREIREMTEQKQRIAEIMPTTNFDDVIIDDGTVDDNKIMLETQQEQDKLAAEERDSQMTDAQFISLLEYEFSQAINYEQAKELYWEYKPTAIINIQRVEAFRAIYEQTLERIHKPKPTTSTKPTDKVKPSTKLYAQGMGRLEWGTTISEIRDSLDIKLPTPRKKSMIEWDDLRLSEHIIYWVYKAYKDEFEQSFNKTLKLYDTAAKRYELIDKLVNKLQRSPVERELELLQAQVKKLEELGVSREDILSQLA